MSRKSTPNFVILVLIFGVCTLLFVFGTLLSHTSKDRRHRKEYGKIYKADDGHYYTRCHRKNGGFSYWEANGSGTTSFGDGGDFSAVGGWTPTSNTPTGLTPTGKVVVEQEGKPTEEVEEESAAMQEHEITDETSESQAESMDAASESGTDSSSSSDSSDGGDGGGGDGGSD